MKKLKWKKIKNRMVFQEQEKVVWRGGTRESEWALFRLECDMIKEDEDGGGRRRGQKGH